MMQNDPVALIRSYWPSAPDAAVASILARMDREGLRFGDQTNAWHEVHRWLIEHDDRPSCPRCGSRMDRRLAEHNLCLERAKRGLPTPPLPDDLARCPCNLPRCARRRRDDVP